MSKDAYTFDMAAEEDHFVTRWIHYAAKRTDAAHDYHEAAALWLLANATPKVKAELSAFPGGLGTNLYLLFFGASTSSRKSTAMKLAREVEEKALPGVAMPDKFSPEGFIEALAVRNRRSAGLILDEFSGLMRSIHHQRHMADMMELLLTVYDGRSYEYRRHSKRVKGGGTEGDYDRVEEPHLSIMGGTTPAIFDAIRGPDLESGLLPRFGIVMPEAKPPRMSFFGMVGDHSQEMNQLTQWLHGIAEWASHRPHVIFEENALEAIDAYALEIEEAAAKHPEDRATLMRQRLAPMGIKLAILFAVGHPEAIRFPYDGGEKWVNERPILRVRYADAESAVFVLKRWQEAAETFSQRVDENDFERVLQRALGMVKESGQISRRKVAQSCKVTRLTLDLIAETLMDRGLITVAEDPSGGGGVWWVYTGSSEAAG